MEVPDAASTAGEGTVGYVDGTEVLGEGATAQVRAEFQKSQKAFSTIVVAICSSQL